MKKLALYGLILFALVVVFGPAAQAALAAPDAAAGWVYTNNDDFTNSVGVFQVVAGPDLKFVKNVPTGGSGCGGGEFASDRTKVLQKQDLLVVADDCSADLAIFTGALSGNLVLKGNIGFDGGDTSLVAAGACVAAGSFSTGNLISYKWNGSTLTKVTTLNAGMGLNNIAATKSGTSYYLGAALYGPNVIYIAKGDPSTCGLTAAGSLAAPGGFGPMAVAFSKDGTKIYTAQIDAGTSVDEGPFPAGPLTPYHYDVGGFNAQAVLVDATASCLYASSAQAPGIVSIPLSGGVPGASATYVGDGTGNFYTGNMAWHNSYKAIFLASTSASVNDVVTYKVGSSCSISVADTDATGITDAYMLSLTAAPQVGP